MAGTTVHKLLNIVDLWLCYLVKWAGMDNVSIGSHYDTDGFIQSWPDTMLKPSLEIQRKACIYYVQGLKMVYFLGTVLTWGVYIHIIYECSWIIQYMQPQHTWHWNYMPHFVQTTQERGCAYFCTDSCAYNVLQWDVLCFFTHFAEVPSSFQQLFS